jgi:hypothetical protein
MTARFVAFGMSLLCVTALAACTSEPDDHRPLPTVSTGEVENRLQEHLARLVATVFDGEVTVPGPTLTRTPGCGDAGPDWAVTPRAKLTVSAGDRDRADRYFDNSKTWLSRSGFNEKLGDTGNWASPVETYEVKSTDGMLAHTELDRNGNQINIMLTGPCTWPADHPDGPPASGRLQPLPPPGTKTKATTAIDNEVCGSPRLYVLDPAADPYAGAGPHPITVLNYGPAEFTYERVATPAGWLAGATPTPANASPQLVACARVEITSDTGRDVTCLYRDESIPPEQGGSPNSFDVFNSLYHITMREARTGTKVGEFTIPGNRPDTESCPYRMVNHHRSLATGIDNNQLARQLRQFYDAPR